MSEAARTSKDVRGFSEEKWERFAKRLHYIVGDPASTGFLRRTAFVPGADAA